MLGQEHVSVKNSILVDRGDDGSRGCNEPKVMDLLASLATLSYEDF